MDLTDKRKGTLDLTTHSYLGKRVKPPIKTHELEAQSSKVPSKSNVLKSLRQGKVV